jgi:hypothetical protein
MRLTALIAIGVILLSSGCFGGGGGHAYRRSASDLTRQVKARKLNAAESSMQSLTCSVWHRQTLDCAGTLRVAGDSQRGHASQTRLHFVFLLRPSGRLGAPYCPIDVVTHEGNPYS